VRAAFSSLHAPQYPHSLPVPTPSRWIVLFVIGICTGVVGFYIDAIADLITVSKYGYIKDFTSQPFTPENFTKVACFFIFLNAGLV